MKNLKQLKKNSGFTIVELLIGIGVIVGFLAFVYGVYSRISTSNHANTMTGDLTTFQTKIHEVYANDPAGYGTGDMTAGVITSKAYPGDLNLSSSNKLTSTFAGDVSIKADTSNQFTITYASVPSGVCIAVANKLASSGEWIKVGAGGEGNIFDSTKDAAAATKANTDAKCNAKPNVSMTFTSN